MSVRRWLVAATALGASLFAIAIITDGDADDRGRGGRPMRIVPMVPDVPDPDEVVSRDRARGELVPRATIPPAVLLLPPAGAHT